MGALLIDLKWVQLRRRVLTAEFQFQSEDHERKHATRERERERDRLSGVKSRKREENSQELCSESEILHASLPTSDLLLPY